MGKRVCAEHGCPTLIDAGNTRCAEHERARDKKRGTSKQRGYGAGFAKAKRATSYTNATHCATCGEPFSAGNPKTAGHIVAIRKGGTGSGIKPECRRCNYGWRRTNS